MKMNGQISVAELYRLYPSALPVLARYQIDLCCGGRHSLEEVARKKGVDLARLLEELEKVLQVKT